MELSVIYRESANRALSTAKSQSRFLGRGCNEALFGEKKGFFSEKGGGNSVNEGFG